MRITRPLHPLLAAALVLLLPACGDDGRLPEPVTKIDVVDSRAETARAGDVDPYVVTPAMTPKAAGRILYEPPASLADVAGADTLVRRPNTGLTSPARGSGAAGRDTSATAPSRPERR